MKTKISLLAAASLLAATAAAQMPAEYTVAPWHGFSECAITYSLDDLTPNQLPVAIPLFDKYGVKVSLNVVTSWVKQDEWPKLKAVVKNGHEVTSHTRTHKNMGELSVEEFTKECSESKRVIKQYTGSESVTLVYPYCVTAHKEIVAKYYISARGCNGQIVPHTPSDMFDISSKVAGTESNDLRDGDDFNRWVDEGVAKNGWCTFLIHAIDDDGGYSPIKSSELEKHLAYVTKNPGKFWVAPFVDITKYIMERDALTIREIKKGNKITVVVGCSAKSPITTLDVPVTISRVLPQGCTKATTNAKNTVVSGGKVMFDVVPGKTYKLICK